MVVKKKLKNMGMKTVVVVTYLMMLFINILANILPINNITTGAVSARYDNLFAPAGFTFSIWIVIYIVLGGHVFYQFKDVFYSPETRAMVQKLRKWFSVSSAANAIWILAWHYDLILLSVLFMILILLSLLRSMMLIGSAKLTPQERLWIKKPFSIYLGWVLVATIANVTALFVKWDLHFFGIPEPMITGIIILIGMVISALTLMRFKDSLIGAVVLWAYYGILMKHINVSGFNQMYPSVINSSIAAIAGIVAAMIYNSYHRLAALKQKFL